MYVPLRNFTKFTIAESILDIKSWLKVLAAHHIPAVACTDKANLFSMVQFYKTALQLKIKPLLGSQFYVQLPDSKKTVDCIFIAKNNNGYIQLSSLISDYYQQARHDAPLPWALVADQCSDLVAIVHQDDIETLTPYLPLWNHHFNSRLLIGLERYFNHKKSLQQSQSALAFCHQHQLPAVVANSVYFLNEDDFETQQIKVCIQQGYYFDDPKRPIHHHRHQRFFTPEEIAELFKDCPEVIENSMLLARKCTVSLVFGNIMLPQFSEDEEKTLWDLSAQGLEERRLLDQHIDKNYAAYQDRLQTELTVICQMGFSGYFLIVSDFIRWAKAQHIPVGPGRGSGAGSLVAYALKITDIDPLQYDLLFERFLNPERVSMPDFDVDFCMDKRDDVIQYVQERYGLQSVSQIATFGTMAAKAVIRDVGRVLHHPFPFVDKIAKMIPLELGITLSEALVKSEELKKAYEEDEVVTQLIDYALKLEGLPRNVGKHAGGVVIAPKPLKMICPLYNEPQAQWHPVTQLDKDDVEAIGLIKFDFLGLKTLTVIDWTYQYAQELGQPIIALEQLPLDDKKSFDLLLEAKTVAVFQLESRGMRDLIIRLKPDCFEDIIALVALFRPGPLQSGMVDDFIDRKHGRSSTLYPHPLSEPILKPTYGVILYQEQVMQLAQTLAGYTLGGADLLRRAMGKKKAEEMAQQRHIFVQGSIAQGIEEDIATFIFDLMEKFAGYGFNKSHSAAYALIAFQTLYLKAHAPAAFIAANMTAEAGNLDKILVLIEDARSLGIEVYSPCINRSEVHFKPLTETGIAFGLGAIKGVGQALLQPIMQERCNNGLFHSFEEFMQRTASIGLSKKAIELLLKVGVFDSLNSNRRSLLEQDLPKFYSKYDRNHAGQGSLFDDDQNQQEPACEDYVWSDKLHAEERLLGFAMSGHLLDPYLSVKQGFWQKNYQLGEQTAKPTLVIIHGLRDIVTSKGSKFTVVQLLLHSHGIEVVLNPGRDRDFQLLEKIRSLIHMRKPALAYFKTVESKIKKSLISLTHLVEIDEFFSEHVHKVVITLDANSEHEGIKLLFKGMSSVQYSCPVEVVLYDENDRGKKPVTLVKDNQGQVSPLSILIEKTFIYRSLLNIALL
ncbi:DNA polymerase III subunit alpha [bacterium]|nr:DNA polymerase III subunit alpha [bacterium]NBW56925.1 DNA polymerase III subunit alpha [bacterium]NBX71533.1 DNA polymerase III subunit alpha [bacterium]